MFLKKIVSKLKLKPLANYQLAYFVALIPFFCIITAQYDNDFWFTINQGRYVLEQGFPVKAINSIHDISFIYQSWGSGTLFYLIHNYIGFYGIVFLLLSVSLLTAFFFYKLCFVVSNNKRGSLYITAIAMLLYLSFIVTRPHIFTVLNLVISLYLLESYIKKDNSKYLIALPFIFLLQINMHGIYYVLLLIILSPYLINSFKFNFFNIIKSDGYRKKPLFIVFLLMILCGFINPYGYKTIIYGFNSYQSNSLLNNTIIELMALNFHNKLDKIFIIVIIMTYVLYFSKLSNKQLRYTLLLIGTSYLAFDATKSFYLFLFCSLFGLSKLFKNNKTNYNEFSKNYHFFHLSLTIIIAVFLLLVINNQKMPENKEFIDFLDTVVEDKEKIKLFTGYEDGSYAEYRGYYCYLDPRGEIFLKSNNHTEDIYEEFEDVTHLKINYKEFIDKYKFDYMLVENESSLGYLMKDNSHKYINVKENEMYILYKRGE